MVFLLYLAFPTSIYHQFPYRCFPYPVFPIVSAYRIFHRVHVLSTFSWHFQEKDIISKKILTDSRAEPVIGNSGWNGERSGWTTLLHTQGENMNNSHVTATDSEAVVQNINLRGSMTAVPKSAWLTL